MNLFDELKIAINKDDMQEFGEHYYQDSYCNSIKTMFIKMGFIKRINYVDYEKIKDVPSDLTYDELKKLTKNIKLPKVKKHTEWGKLMSHINESNSDDILTIKVNKYHNSSTSSYVKNLRKMGYIEIIRKYKEIINHKYTNTVIFEIKKLKNIPCNLTTTLMYKKLYDPIYKRMDKIKKIQEGL